MSRAPWLLLPLLFLPNLGFFKATRFGTLEISDYLIWPYLVALVVVRTRRRRRAPKPAPMRQIERVFLIFLGWAFVSTITEGLRYEYEGWYEISFGLLKLSKFGLYATAAWLTVFLVRGPRDLNRLLWSLTVGGLITTLALPLVAPGAGYPVNDSVHGFKATNAISVEVAVLLAFLGVAWALGWGSRSWRRIAPWVVALMTIGLAFSRGRGGWLAVLIGLVWFLYRRGFLKQRTIAITLVFAAAAILAYQQVPVFRLDVDRTLKPDSSFLAKYDAGVLGFDEGARLTTWAHEGAKLIEAPILGRGFFNRFPGSGLWWTGSHNFWLQMFLETGIPGGLAVLAIMWILWRETRRCGVLPVEVSILVAFVGGLGGEYFYGGMPLLTFVVSVSPIIYLQRISMAHRSLFHEWPHLRIQHQPEF